MVQPLWKTSISSEVKDIQSIQPSSSTLGLYLFMVILFMCACVCAKLLQSCLTLCDPTDCSLPGSSVHGILQATILEWVAISFSRGSSQSRD